MTTPLDFSRYTPPGVYVEDVSQPITTPLGIPNSTVTLVGSARGYQVVTEILPLQDDKVALKNTGVLPDTAGAVNLSVASLDKTTLAETTDYTLERGAGPSDPTYIKRVLTSTVENGTQVLVTYSFADESYYAPQTFERYQDVQTVYGPALSADPSATTPVLSPLALAARISFENGAQAVRCLAVEPTTVDDTIRDRFQQAYAKIVTDYEVTLVVPVWESGELSPTDYTSLFPSLVADLKTHCEQASANGLGRIGLAGPDTIYDDAVTKIEDIAVQTASRRIVLADPPSMLLYNTESAQPLEVGGMYLASAFGGRLAAGEIRRGLTKIQVYSFLGIPQEYKIERPNSVKNTMSSKGVSVLEQSRTGALVVRHGVTTKVDSLIDAEISIVRTGDVLYQMLQHGLENADLIGAPIDADMEATVKSIVTGILEQGVTETIYEAYTEVEVRQQTLPSGDPTAIEVSFAYKPFLPLNYITVTFAIDLNTGEVTTASDENDIVNEDTTA